MNPLEETTIRLVAEGEATKGRIVLSPNGERYITRINGTETIQRMINPSTREKIVSQLERNWLKYNIEHEKTELSRIYRGKALVTRNLTETENIWFAQNEEALRSPDFIDSRDFERILNTGYVQSDQNLINMLKQYR